MDTVSLAQSIPNSTPSQETVTATVVSSPTSSAFAAESAEPTSNSTRPLINVNASRVSEDSLESAQSALLELKPPLTAQAAPTVVPTRSFKVENASARLAMLITLLKSVHPAVKFLTVS